MQQTRITLTGFVTLLAITFALVTPHASAQPRATTVKISGIISEPPAEGRARATWNLRANGTEVKLFVTRLEILAGGPTDAEIFRQLRVNRGLIVATGEAPAMSIIEETAAGKAITIQGTLRWAETPAVLLVSTATN